MRVFAIKDADGKFVTSDKKMSKTKPPRIFEKRSAAQGVVTQYKNGNGGFWTRDNMTAYSKDRGLKFPLEVVEFSLEEVSYELVSKNNDQVV